MTKWTEKRLRRLFDRYKWRFFNCRLVGWTVVIRKNLGVNCGGRTYPIAKRISMVIPNWMDDREVRGNLLHEMAHAVTGDMHHVGGEPWCEEMERLRRAGAPAKDPGRYIRSLRE